MANGLGAYFNQDEDYPLHAPQRELVESQDISPMQMVAVPGVTRAEDLAALYEQKMREMALKEQAGLEQLSQYIEDYKKTPTGINWAPAAALFDNPRLMQAAQSMPHLSPDEKAKNILSLQQQLQDKKHLLTKSQLDAVGHQLKAMMSAQNDAARKVAQDKKIEMENQRSKDWSDFKKQEMRLREQELEEKRMMREGVQSRADQRQQVGLEQKEAARLDKDVQALEKRIGDMAPGIAKKLQNIEELIPGGIEGDTTQEVPGAGVGKFLIPDWALSEQASEVQQNARGLAADLIKLQSGTAASDKEVDRKLKELGMAPGSKSSTFRSGLKRLKSQFVEELKNKEAGFRPEAKEIYRQRGGLTHESIKEISKKPQAPVQPPMSFEEWKRAKGL